MCLLFFYAIISLRNFWQNETVKNYEKNVKIIVLSGGKTLISEIIEINNIIFDLDDPDSYDSDSDDDKIDWELVNPFVVDRGELLDAWLKECTDQRKFKIISDNLLTVIEPIPSLIDDYLHKLKSMEEKDVKNISTKQLDIF